MTFGDLVVLIHPSALALFINMLQEQSTLEATSDTMSGIICIKLMLIVWLSSRVCSENIRSDLEH